MNRFFNSPGSKDNAPRMIVENKGYWYFCPNVYGWEFDQKPHGFSAGDCCWWTGLGVLGYDDELLMQGLLQLTPIKGGVWRRHPFGNDLANTINPVDEFTRDHLISAITALVVKDKNSAKQAIRLTERRISTRKRLGLGDWVWLKAIQHEGTVKGKLLARLFSMLKIPVVLISWAWSELVREMIGSKANQVHPNDKEMPSLVLESSSKEWMRSKLRPFAFQFHLWALQIHALRELGLTKAGLMSRIVRGHAGKFNYLVALLTGKKINKSMIKGYESRRAWIWQSWIDNITGRQVFKCTPTEAKYNALDKDLLWKLYDNL